MDHYENLESIMLFHCATRLLTFIFIILENLLTKGEH